MITSISYSKLSGLIASGSTDKYVRLWDPKSAGNYLSLDLVPMENTLICDGNSR